MIPLCIWYQNSGEPYFHCWVGLTKWWYQPYTRTYSDLLGGTCRIIYAKRWVGLLYHRVLWRWLECWSDTSHICCGMLAGAFWVRIWVIDKIKSTLVFIAYNNTYGPRNLKIHPSLATCTNIRRDFKTCNTL